jgi:hypothetical protein
MPARQGIASGAAWLADQKPQSEATVSQFRRIPGVVYPIRPTTMTTLSATLAVTQINRCLVRRCITPLEL